MTGEKVEKAKSSGPTGTAVEENPPEEKVEEKRKIEFSEKQLAERETGLRLERNGEHMLERQHFDHAMDFFLGAVHVYKKINDFESLGRVYFKMGQCQEQQGKYKEALDYFRDSKKNYGKINDRGNYASAADRAAKVLYFEGNTQEAKLEYRDAIGFGCENSEIFNNLAFMQMDDEEFEEAEKNLRKALKLREKEESPETHITHNNLGVIEYIKGNYKKAQYHFETGLEMDFRSPEEDRTIQYVVFAKPVYKDEEFTSYRVFRDVETRACIMLNIAAARVTAGEKEDTVLPMLEEALMEDRDRSYLYEAAGWIYLNLGDDKKALGYFKRALPYDPTNEDLRRVIDLINPYLYARVGRNEPCPCGSGKKYKKCHGAVV